MAVSSLSYPGIVERLESDRTLENALRGGQWPLIWNTACFNVTTGDVEDAPALDPLEKFDVSEKNGALYIHGEESAIKNKRRVLNIKCKASTPEKVVIVGGGSGGLGAMEALRGGGFKGEITVITKEGYRPIDRTKLSKALLTDLDKLAWRSQDFYRDSGIELAEDEVKGIDFQEKTVSTNSGKKYSYTKLILASGGTPRWLPLDGLKGDLKNVFTLRTLTDAQNIIGAAGEDGGKNIVVVGSSFIGMEVGNCLAGKKHHISIIGMEEEPMERVMGKQLGKIFKGLLEKNGVKFYMGASVEKATPSSTDSSKVGAVHLKDGTKLEADVVVLGVGIAPETTYLKDNNAIKLLDDKSIEVDESYAVKGVTDAYAIGDISTFPYHGPGGNGKPLRIEHWNVASNQGRSVATTINGLPKKPGFIPVFWSALGMQLRYCGNTVGGYDDVFIDGNTDPKSEKGPAFIAYYTKGEDVVAAASMGKDPFVMKVAELMRRGKCPSKSDLKKGVDIFSIEVPSEIKI
jgi:NADPH-dependent 2,4-dienoyl-CoA reductase/sulfur reductase-like enzyme